MVPKIPNRTAEYIITSIPWGDNFLQSLDAALKPHRANEGGAK